MTTSRFTDETLMRYADGELDEPTSADLERALETDDALAERLGLFVETRSAARAALAPLLDEPVPTSLRDSVQAMVDAKRGRDAGKVIAMVPRARQRWLLPLAASIAAAAGGLAGYWLAAGGTPARGLQVAGVVEPGLRGALATVASGSELRLPGSDRRFRAIATFRDSTQTLCREFEVDDDDRWTVIAVACAAASEWQIKFAVAAPGDNDGYAPASSTEALDAYLAAIDAADPLAVGEEKAALESLSRPVE